MTQVNWTKQLLMAASLFVLGTAAYWLEYKHKPEKESAEEANKKPIAIKDSAVKEVQLVAKDKKFSLKCLDFEAKLCKPGDSTSKWGIEAPLKLKADEQNANGLVSTMNNLTATEVIDLKDETPEKRKALLKEYGLDAESRGQAGLVSQVKVVTAAGEMGLFLGQMHPMGESQFGLVQPVTGGGKPDETKVYLVPSFFKENLEKDLTYWRDKKIFSISSGEIGALAFEHSSTRFRVERKKDDKGNHIPNEWVVLGSKNKFPGDFETIDGVLSSLTGLTAKGFVSENKSDKRAKDALKGYGVALSLQYDALSPGAKGSDPVAFKIYKKKDGKVLYATVSNLDPLFELEEGATTRFEKTEKDLRLNKMISSSDRFETRRLQFASKANGYTPLDLTQKDGKWFDAKGTEVLQDKVMEFFDHVSGNKIKDFLSGTAIPDGQADGLEVSFGDEKSDKKHQMTFWKKGGKLFAVDKVSGDSRAYEIENSVGDGLPWATSYFYPVKPAASPSPSMPKK